MWKIDLFLCLSTAHLSIVIAVVARLLCIWQPYSLTVGPILLSLFVQQFQFDIQSNDA